MVLGSSNLALEMPPYVSAILYSLCDLTTPIVIKVNSLGINPGLEPSGPQIGSNAMHEFVPRLVVPAAKNDLAKF